MRWRKIFLGLWDSEGNRLILVCELNKVSLPYIMLLLECVERNLVTIESLERMPETHFAAALVLDDSNGMAAELHSVDSLCDLWMHC